MENSCILSAQIDKILVDWFCWYLYISVSQPFKPYQVIIAQWLARWLTNGEVRSSKPGKGDNLFNLMTKEENFINLNLNTILVWVDELTGPV